MSSLLNNDDRSKGYQTLNTCSSDGYTSNKTNTSNITNVKNETNGTKITGAVMRPDQTSDLQTNINIQHHENHSELHKNITKKIGLAPLVVLIFYSVSGGPFGIEDIVRAGGPFYALAGFSLLLVWAIPEALITAELSTAMPEASGSGNQPYCLYLLTCCSMVCVCVCCPFTSCVQVCLQSEP